MLPSRVEELRQVIGEYEEERNVTQSRLEALRMRRARLELARQIMLEHGAVADANQLIGEIDVTNHHIQASEVLLAKLEHLLAVFRAGLAKVEAAEKAR